MRLGAIVQARMSSRRLPGKVLARLDGQPILQWVLERLARCPSLAENAVATSDEPDDDAIEAFCRDAGTRCVRGPLEHVAERFRQAARAMKLDAFVRVCADSPLIDAASSSRRSRCSGVGASIWSPTCTREPFHRGSRSRS